MVGPHGGNYGSLVPAIGALFPVRVADPTNSSVAALAPGGNFPGAWKSTAGMGHVDLALTVAAATDLIVEHTDNVGAGAEAALTETWKATGAHPSFPTRLPRLFYRARLLDTGGGGAVTLVATLDPRALDHETPLQTILAPALATASTTTYVQPLGARSVGWGLATSAAHEVYPNNVRLYTTNAGGAQGSSTYNGGTATADGSHRFPVHCDATDRFVVHNLNGANVDLIVFWYP